MQTGFIFGQGTDISDPKELARRRAIVDAMMAQQAQQGAPRNLGEGIFSAGNSIANALTDRNLKRKEDKARQDAAGALPGIVDLLNGGTPPFFPSGSPQSQPIPARDPNSSEAIASDTMSALGKPNFTPGDRDSFVAAMMPHAMEVSKRTGLDPRLVIAQAAQETGWGKSAPGNNFFGIKSHGKAGGNNLQTREFMNGQNVTINDSFRAYGGMGESAQDYAQFLMDNPRYRDMLSAGDLDGQLAALGRSGYATDPNYASSVGSIARSIQLPGGEMPSAQSAQPNAGTRTFNPEIINQLAALSSNPYASEGQRQIAALLMQQQIQQMMPQRKDPIEVGGVLLDPNNGYQPIFDSRKPEAGAMPLRTPEERAAWGIPPEDTRPYAVKPGGIPQVVGGASTEITLDMNGNPRPELLGTQGLVAIPDPNVPQGYRVEPAPGSPLAQEAANAAATQERREGNRQSESSIVTTAAQRARQAAESRTLGGIGGRVAAINPGSTNAELYRQVDVLRSQAQLGNLQAMREASPTGGALGSVTEKELQILADKSGALDPASPNFLRDLDDYERTLLRTIHGPEEGDRIFEATRDNGDGWTTINGVRVREKK